MPPSNLEKIEKLITLLEKEELVLLGKKIQYLMTTKKRKCSPVDEDAFYSIIGNELKKKIRYKAPPLPVFKKTNDYKLFSQVFVDTLDYMEEVFKREKLTRPKKLHFYLVATKIVLRDCEGSPVPLSMRSMLTAYKLLPGLIERSFPGYVQSGLLPMILKQKYMNKKPLEEVKNEKR